MQADPTQVTPDVSSTPSVPDVQQEETTTVARLNSEGVYYGIDVILKQDLTDHHVHLPHGCDLPPGKYRWDFNKKAFVPLPKGTKPVEYQPHTVNAIALGFIYLYSKGAVFPKETIDWLDYYMTTIDAAGCAATDESRLMVKSFMERNK